MARGGRRPGAGRKRRQPATRRRYVAITDEQAKLLRMWGRGDLSAGLRWLIDAAELFVQRAQPEPPRPERPPARDT